MLSTKGEHYRKGVASSNAVFPPVSSQLSTYCYHVYKCRYEKMGAITLAVNGSATFDPPLTLLEICLHLWCFVWTVAI